MARTTGVRFETPALRDGCRSTAADARRSGVIPFGGRVAERIGETGPDVPWRDDGGDRGHGNTYGMRF